MKRRFLQLGVLVIVTGLLVGAVLPAFAQGGGDDPVFAPPFPEGLEWVNVPGPLTWEDLRGKVVLLDFWTYGCINCIHIIPDLERLEAEFPDELVVIGVHSAKFDNEGDTANIRQIVQRYEIAHPVINDNNFAVWGSWGIRAWPTVMLIDPRGAVVGYREGEGIYDVLRPAIVQLVQQYDEAGQINREPIALSLESDTQPDTTLAFPGKVLADPAGNRLFIADSNHNRIVVADLTTYEVLDVIGGPEAGNATGSFAAARFDKPQGLALSADGQTLYVADTDNHAVREIDLAAGTVEPLLGTGRQASGQYYGQVPPDGALNSPWDLALDGDSLYIAMAGSHQIWRYDFATQALVIHTGSGAEGLVDATNAQSQLAQPSGLTIGGDRLYFADSEASAIRSAALDPNGEVTTYAGTGLFDFGDRDGTGDDVLLQHPLGVAFVDGLLYVADTYNSKIRVLDPQTREVTSLSGDPAGGYVDGPLADARFDEPGGISYADGRLYVADTNNHAIRVIDLEAGQVDTVRFPNTEALAAAAVEVVETSFNGTRVELDPQSFAAGDGLLMLDIHLPEDYKINDLATSTVEFAADETVVTLPAGQPVVIEDASEPVSVPVSLHDGQTEVDANLTLYYCEAVNESFCFLERVQLALPVTVGDQAAGENTLLLDYTVIPPAAE